MESKLNQSDGDSSSENENFVMKFNDESIKQENLDNGNMFQIKFDENPEISMFNKKLFFIFVSFSN